MSSRTRWAMVLAHLILRKESTISSLMSGEAFEEIANGGACLTWYLGLCCSCLGYLPYMKGVAHPMRTSM